MLPAPLEVFLSRSPHGTACAEVLWQEEYLHPSTHELKGSQ